MILPLARTEHLTATTSQAIHNALPNPQTHLGTVGAKDPTAIDEDIKTADAIDRLDESDIITCLLKSTSICSIIRYAAVITLPRHCTTKWTPASHKPALFQPLDATLRS